ncbi:hypothetical protein KR038_011635 [Drosophila bunnanda]|nr:hypothetical protein KR038_011635 [Drosophila bunnanda]
MDAPSEGNGNPEENPKRNRRKRPRKRNNASQTETSSEENTDASRDSLQVIHVQPSHILPPMTLEARDSITTSLGTSGSTHRSTAESQNSGYTSESIYPASIGYVPLSESTSSTFVSTETLHGTQPMNFRRDIHVATDPSSPEEEIQTVRMELQELLTNAIFHIGQWYNQAIYIITYNYM